MNVLLYVVTMVFVIAALTYAKLENVRSFMGMQSSFVHYMGAMEQGAAERASHFWYDKIRVKEVKKDSTQERQPGSRLSFYLFLQAKERDRSNEVYTQTRELSKRLMSGLYSEMAFFKEVADKRPNVLDELINELQAAAEHLPPDQKIDKVTGMLNLEWASKEMHTLFYKMMHGLPATPKPVIEDSSEVVEEETDSALESDEEKAPAGYESLIDYITVRPTTKVRVYLASRPLLQAIFGDAHLVNSVIDARNTFYKRVRNSEEKETMKRDLSKEFESSFAMSGTAPEFKVILSFSVTNTDPRSYE